MLTRGRAKGSKNVNSKIRGAVLLAKSLNPNWSALQVRNYLVRNKPTEKSIIPKLRAIQSIIREGAPSLDAISQSGLDTPWHFGIMAQGKHNIPPEVVPHIFMAMEWAEQFRDPFGDPQKPVSIRQAQWIGRLSALINIDRLKERDRPQAAAFLYRWSRIYTTEELLCELSGTSFDTTDIDKHTLNIGNAIRKGSFPDVVGYGYSLKGEKDGLFVESLVKDYRWNGEKYIQISQDVKNYTLLESGRIKVTTIKDGEK